MKTRIVNQWEVARILPMQECIPVMEEVLMALARGDAVLPLRTLMWLPDRSGLMAVMPSALTNIDRMGVKVISVFPGNHGTPFDSHQGAVLLFENRHGQLLAILDATAITTIRTAAVSGVATKLLARPDARTLCILGSGVQARSHLEAMLKVRNIEQVRVWSRTRDSIEKFVKSQSDKYGIPIEPASSAYDAVKGADIVCTTTAAHEPVLQGEWLQPGTHINAVGMFSASTRELDTKAVVISKLYVDRRESTVNEAGDFLVAKSEGAIDEQHIIGELGELLLGRIPGRTSHSDITLFKSLGLAIEDIASADYIYKRAQETGTGTVVELGGERDEES